MASIFTRCMLFLCSYAPLTFISCILLAGVWPWWGIGVLSGVGVVSMLMTVLYFGDRRRRGYEYKKRLREYSKRDSEVMSYVASYLIPFVTFPLGTPQQQLALLAFMLILLVVYVNSNMMYINPTLNLFGYHLYEVEIEQSEHPHYYIARRRPERNQEIRFVMLSEDIYLEK